MSFASQLIELTDINCREIEKIPKIKKMLSGDFSAGQYVHFMTDLYPIVSNFCPTMAAAASRCAQQYDLVRNYLYDHIHEEKGHEEIVLQDVASFGVSPDEIINSSVREPVQAMLAFNYHSALMGNSCSVLGMVYVLEIISSVYAGKVAHALSNALGRNISEGFVFLHSHSSADMEHMAKLRQLFQTIDSPEFFSYLMNSIKMNFYLFRQVLEQENA
jgi:pyrroloquinoline quinone (PQQ) biosynthesis protein C